MFAGASKKGREMCHTTDPRKGHMTSKFRFLSRLSRVSKDKRASGPRLLGRLLRDEEGAYLLIMTAAIPTFIGLAALATEGALLFYNQRNVQSAADAAAYSAAIAYSLNNTADITTQAKAIVANYGFDVGTGNGQANVVSTVDTTTYSPLTAINVTVTWLQLPILSSIWVGNNPFSRTYSAKAIISGGTLPSGSSGGCILSLASSGNGIQLGGTTSIQNSDATCGIYSNSSIALSGNASITGGAVGAAGTVSVGGSANIGPPPSGYTQGDGAMTNPYTGVTTLAPSTGTGCTFTDTVIPSGGGSLSPGTYCTSKSNKPAIDINGPATYTPGTYIVNGDFNVKGGTVTCPTCSTTNTSTFTFNGNVSITVGANVTLGAGNYIFVGPGQLSVDSQSTLTAKSVTLMFTDPSGAAYPQGANPRAMDISSGANILLEPPTSGPYQGILIIGNSNIPLDTQFNLQANGSGTCTSTSTSNCIGGIIYLPTADFTWQGGPILTGGCTQMIAYRLIMNGNAQFSNSNCNFSGGGGGGGGGAKPIGNVVTLVK
jgi:Flp pilus assembly protein TadG